MNASLLRRDLLVLNTRRVLITSVTVSALTTGMVGVMGWAFGGDYALLRDHLFSRLVLGMTGYSVLLVALLAIGQASPLTRATEFQLELPVSFPTLWLSRFQALLIALWVPLIPPVVFGLALVGPGTRGLVLEKTAALVAAWFLFVAVLQSAWPGEARWKPGAAPVAVLALFGVGLLGAGVLSRGFWFPLAATAVGGALAGHAWKRLPVSVDVVGVVPTRDTTSVKRYPTARPGALHRWLRRLTLANPAGPGVALLALALFLQPLDRDGMPNVMILLLPFWLTLYSNGLLQHSNGLVQRSLVQALSLPIQRRLLFAYLALPLLFWAAIGVGAAQITNRLLPRQLPAWGTKRVAVYYRPCEPYVLSVPYPLWHLTTAETAPEIRLDSGAVRPAVERLGWGLPLGAYNPYDLGPEPSRAFVAEQLSRAIRDAFGTDIPAAELLQRYLSTPAQDDALVDTPMLLRDYPQLERRGWPRVPWLSLVLLWWLSLAVGVRDNTPPASRREWRRWIVKATAGVIGAATLVLGFLLAGIWWPEVFGALMGRVASAAEAAVPANPLLAAVVLGALCAAAFFSFERRFARMEMPRAYTRTSFTFLRG